MSIAASVADLSQSQAARWARATRHPFVAAVRDGTLPQRAFDTWLVEDHHFVSDLLWFQARLLARAPRAAQAVLAAGAVTLVDELAWFRGQAASHGLDLEAPALPATRGYSALLRRLDETDVALALTGLWALERVYLDAWSFAAPGASQYREFVTHWTTPEFASYVDALQAAADDAVSGLSQLAELEAVIDDVLDAEISFWDTAFRPNEQAVNGS